MQNVSGPRQNNGICNNKLVNNNNRGFVLIPVSIILLILTIATLFFLKSNYFSSRNKPRSINIEKINTPSKDAGPTSTENEDIQNNQIFSPPAIDISEVKRELISIVKNGIDKNIYSWNNGLDVYIEVYKNTDGPTIVQEAYESGEWTYNLDRDIEIINNLKIGENLVNDDTKSYGKIYYFVDYREIGNRKYLVMYKEFPPSGSVGRTYKFIDVKNANLIDIFVSFYDKPELRKYMERNAKYYEEYKTYKYGGFPQVFADFFQRFEDGVLKDL